MTVINDADEVRTGSALVDEVYLGTTRLWPSAPAVSAPTNYGQDGDWVTKGWGTSGYAIADNALSTSLPAGVSFVTTATRYTWYEPYAHSSAIRIPPPSANSSQCCWYAGTAGDFTFTFSQAWKGTLRAYSMSNAPDQRSQRLEMFLNGVSQNSIDLLYTDSATWFGSGIANAPMLPGGRWIGWDVDLQAGDVLKMSAIHLAGGNSVVSGFVFDLSAWTPASVSGLGLWLEADKITGLADGASVTSWQDASGQGRHATPVATAPTYRAAGMNGKPTVKFASSRMLVAGWGTAMTGKTEYTMFQVLSQQSFANVPVISTAPTNGLWQWLTEFSPDGGIYWGHQNGSYHQYYAAIPTATPVLLTYSYATGSPKLFKNGSQVIGYASNGSGLGGIAVPNVGADAIFGSYYEGSYPLDNHVAAVLWYDRALTDPERVQVEEYLRTKWGI